MTTLHLLTTGRRHLVDIAGILADGIGPDFMRSAANPVVVTVRGTERDGKKIFPDGAVQKLFGIPDAREKGIYQDPARADIPSFQGRPDFDERWRGRYGDLPVEISFINAGQGRNFSRAKLDANFALWSALFICSTPLRRGSALGGLAMRHLEDHVFGGAANRFLRERREQGGLAFVHNAHKTARTKAWIDIWVEKSGGHIVGYAQPPEAPPRLRDLFRQEAAHNDWARYLRIEVKNPALSSSPRFRESLDRLADYQP